MDALTNSKESYKEGIPAVSASVKLWTKRVKDARAFWESDFKRMRDNMQFCAGYQWQGQDKIDDDRYVSNMVVRLVNQKVASLYARNPKVKAERRRRMDFVMWDGRPESLQQAVGLTANPETMAMDPASGMEAAALLADYARGRQHRDVIDKIGETLGVLFEWFQDNQTPPYKVQMKQMVRRAVITGVGYVRVNFARSMDRVLSTTHPDLNTADRLKLAQDIMRQLSEGTITEDSEKVVELMSLLQSVSEGNATAEEVQEKLVFDFPPSTTVIPDTRCRALRGFVGARWVAQEYLMSLGEVNSFFGTEIKAGGDIVTYNAEGQTLQGAYVPEEGKEPTLCVWEVFDIQTQSSFFICDGYCEFLEPPVPAYPKFKNFWPLFALTLNDIEIEPNQQKATIFPPSDVDLMKSAQKEWNRTRNSLRAQRKANAPKYGVAKGALTPEDKALLESAPENAIIELNAQAVGGDINKIIVPLVPAPIDPMMYDTAPLTQDIFSVGGNEDTAQPASSKSTATAATINEQSRIIVTGSNVDDLDDMLSDIAEAGGEIMLRELSIEVVQRIAGPGAVWPQMGGEDFVNFIYLNIVAASSGRPNQALEVSKFQQIAPILISCGVNPWFIAREAIKRLDDRLDLDEALSMPGAAISAMPVAAMGQGPAQGASPQPARGAIGATGAGQMPGGTTPRPSMEKPALKQ